MENYIPNNQNTDSKFKRDWNQAMEVLRRQQLQTSTDIKVVQTTHGTFLTVADRIKHQAGEAGLNWANVFNMTGSYNVNDVVLVDSNVTYSVPFEFTGSSSVPALCPGLFLCINAVPASASRNSYNVYYPVYPTIPSSSVRTVSGSLANQTFWQPLSPQKKMTICIDGTSVVAYVNCVISGSTFDPTQLPYHI
jgi:hypothetical protein